MKYLKRIQEIEDEIMKLAHLEDKLRRYESRGCTLGEKVVIGRELKLIDRRIERAQYEISALEGSNFVAIQTEKREVRYMPIDARPPVRFFGIEILGETAKAA